MRQVRQGASWSGNERNRVFLHGGVTQEGTPRYADVSALSGMDFPDDARALGVTDWDHDGDLDVWIRNRTAPRLRLMANQHVQKARATDSITLRLEGTKSNRDAIGGRVIVALKGEKQPLIQTVRAGGGFLSQSSKSLHFGLGSSGEVIQSIAVRWPNGTTESFSGITPGSRAVLIEGTGAARIETKDRNLALKPKPVVLENAGDRLTSVFPRRILAPALSFLPETRGPLWVILWSKDCPHCHAELQAMTAAAAGLKKAGLKVLAISLEDESSNAFFKSIAFPFPTMVVDETILARIQGLQACLFDQPPPPSVPLSLLLTAGPDRAITAIFRGAVGPEMVLAHLPLTRASDTQLRDAAAPYTGQWYTRPQPSETLSKYLAEKMHAHDRLASAYYYEHAGLTATAARIHYDVGMDGNGTPKAESAFRKAIALKPDFAKAHNNLGALLANQRRFKEARSCFEQAAKLEPSNEKAQLNLKLLEQMQ